MTELQISPRNPWAPPSLEAVTVPFVCKPETDATTGRVIFGLFALFWGGMTVPGYLAQRGHFEPMTATLGTLLAIGSLAAAWAWPRLVRTTTITAEGIVHERHRATAHEALPWSAVESITPVPGGADTVALRFRGAPLVQVQGRPSDRRTAIEAIYAFALPTLTQRLRDVLASGEHVRFHPYLGTASPPRGSSPRGLWVDRDGTRRITWWRQTTLAWRDVESIEWRGYGRAVLHARGKSLTVDGTVENAAALLAVIPELVARDGTVPLEGVRPPSTRWYAALYARALVFGVVFLVFVAWMMAPEGRFLELLGPVVRRMIEDGRNSIRVLASFFGSLLLLPLVVHLTLARTHWRARRRAPQPTSLWTGPGVDTPQP